MLKKMIAGVTLALASMSWVYAAVDVNAADQSQLESVKGLGPAKAKAILEERSKNGPFKDAGDLGKRVKGLGEKSVAKLQAEGLSVGASVAGKSVEKSSSSVGDKK
jgi:competence protein ComEA